MSSFIICDDYSIMYQKNENRILIGLPPTISTVRDTLNYSHIKERKIDITDEELCSILGMVMYICKETNNEKN